MQTGASPIARHDSEVPVRRRVRHKKIQLRRNESHEESANHRRSTQDKAPSDCPNAKARTVEVCYTAIFFFCLLNDMQTNRSASTLEQLFWRVAKAVNVEFNSAAGVSACGLSQKPGRQRFVAASPPGPEAPIITNAPTGSRCNAPCIPG